MEQPQNLYPAQNGQVGGVEPLMYNQGQPMVTAQPIPQASSMAPMNQPIVDPIYGIQSNISNSKSKPTNCCKSNYSCKSHSA